MPADWIRNTKVPALPSMIGTSSPDTSTNALSMPRPANADIRCSTVETRAPSFSITVAIVVLVTLSACAGIAGLPGRSERQKTMPVSIGAGRSTMTTFWPVCTPTPVARTTLLRVRWKIMDRGADAPIGNYFPNCIIVLRLRQRGNPVARGEPPAKLRLGERTREEIALKTRAAERGERRTLRLRLHALCHHIQTEFVADCDDHTHQV